MSHQADISGTSYYYTYLNVVHRILCIIVKYNVDDYIVILASHGKSKFLSCLTCLTRLKLCFKHFFLKSKVSAHNLESSRLL